MNIEVDMDSNIILDRSIEEVAKEAIPKISIVGVGGGGSNIVSWMKKDIVSARVLALNTDAQHLSMTKADERILLGYKTTGGLGCGGFPEQGELAAEESAVKIEETIGESDIVFITSTFGGGTGTGASPVIGKISKELGGLTIGVVTIPFEVEGTRIEKAKEGLKKFIDSCDSVIVIDNNKLRKVAGNLPIKDAFGVANEQIADFIKNISEAIAIPSLINLDFADMNAIMKDGGVCAVGFGEGSGDNKVEDAVEKALEAQLLDIGDIKKTKGALVYFEGGEDMTLEDVNRSGERVMERISPSARVTWGARVNNELKDKLRATVILAGVDSPFLIKKTIKKTVKTKKIDKKTPMKQEKSPEKIVKKPKKIQMSNIKKIEKKEIKKEEAEIIKKRTNKSKKKK